MIDFIFLLKSGLIFAAVSLVTYMMVQRRKYVKQLENIPGPTPYPILGNLELFNTKAADTLPLFQKWHKMYGDHLVYWVGPDPVLLVRDPEIINLISSTGKFADKSIEYRFLEQYMGNQSLLTAAGDDWYHKRKLLNPCFHTKVMESFNDSFNSHSRKFIKYLSKYDDNRESFDFMAESKLITLETLMDTMMGLNVNLLEDKQNAYLYAIQKAREITMTRSYSIFHRSEFFFNYSNLKKEGDKAAEIIRKYVRDVVISRKEKRKTQKLNGVTEDKGTRKAILDMFLDLVDEGNAIPDEEMENEINTFMFAGHDTTAVALSYFLFAMGKHPEIQEKVAKEIIEELNFSRIEQSDVNRLEYFNRCLKESMRLFPTVPLIGKILYDPIKTENFFIPSGTNITINLYSMHNDERLFPNPDQFDPDRFLPENIEKSVPHSYTPFASGMRNCIGQRFALMELKVLLVYILAHYKIEAMGSVEDLRMGNDIVLTPFNGLYLKIQRRHPSFLFANE